MPKAVPEVAACNEAEQKTTAELQELEQICKASWARLLLAEIAEKVAALNTSEKKLAS